MPWAPSRPRAVLDGDGFQLAFGEVAEDAADVEDVAAVVVGFAGNEAAEIDSK